MKLQAACPASPCSLLCPVPLLPGHGSSQQGREDILEGGISKEGGEVLGC